MSEALHVLAGTHLVFDDISESSHALPYKLVRMLGHGGTASVEMVRDINTGSVYARKIIRNVYSRNVADAKQRFLNEVHIMQRLQPHEHIVKVHATCIKNRELTIILDPVADGGDLATFLQNYRDTEKSWAPWSDPDLTNENRAHNEILWEAPGCYAAALDFIHQMAIRHKDIKPQNILIHQGRVMYADFGLSYDSSDAGHSTTAGQLEGLSKKYCAPEVAEWGSRNSSSDIFSLDCVFLEILLAINQDDYWDEVYKGNFYETLRVSPNMSLLMLDMSMRRTYPSEFCLIQNMTIEDPAMRPTAGEVRYELISNVRLDSIRPLYCCYCSQIYQDADYVRYRIASPPSPPELQL